MESRRFKGFGDERRREEKLARGSFYNANMRGDSNCWYLLNRCRQCRSKESERKWTRGNKRKKKERRKSNEKKEARGSQDRR